MTEKLQRSAEKLVAIHQARDEWEGTLLTGLLADSGIEATLQRPPSMPPLDTAEHLTGSDKTHSILVLESAAAPARQVIAEFLAAATDPAALVEEAAQKLRVDQATIHRLRGELAEERRTFAFLEWIGVMIFGAGALLWVIWPPWLKAVAPQPGLRWVMVLLLAVAAGLWARSQR